MKIVYKTGQLEIFEVSERYGSDFYVYDGDVLVKVCPSIGMAHEVLAGCL